MEIIIKWYIVINIKEGVNTLTVVTKTQLMEKGKCLHYRLTING